MLGIGVSFALDSMGTHTVDDGLFFHLFLVWVFYHLKNGEPTYEEIRGPGFKMLELLTITINEYEESRLKKSDTKSQEDVGLEEAEKIVDEFQKVTSALSQVGPTEFFTEKHSSLVLSALLPYDIQKIKAALNKVYTTTEKLSFVFNKWKTSDNQNLQEDLTNRRDRLKKLLLQLDSFVPDGKSIEETK